MHISVQVIIIFFSCRQCNFRGFLMMGDSGTTSCIDWSITMTSHECNAVSNHWSFHCLFKSLCRPTSKQRQSLHHWNFVKEIDWWILSQRASNVENVSIWWCHHARGHLNIKILFCLYNNSHYKDKTVLWASYIHNGNTLHRKSVFTLKWAPDF